MIKVKHKYNYYKLLSVSETADTVEIKRSFRLLAKKYHPDKNSSESAKEYFQLLNEAYQILTDPIKREQYDIISKTGHFGNTSNEVKPNSSEERRQKREERRKANYEYSYNVHTAPQFFNPPRWVKAAFYLVGLLFGVLVNYFSILNMVSGEWGIYMFFVNILGLVVFLDAGAGLLYGEALFSERLFGKIKSWLIPKF